jgi:ADP-ribose pyrophosphatase YjhB (NUDIX family)
VTKLELHPHDESHAYRFCPRCASPLERRLLKSNEPERLVCAACGFVFYLDPKIAVGTIIRAPSDRLVLVRRAIDPGYGKWVFPGGYVDRGETLTAAAVREAREECGLDVQLDGLVNIYSYAGRAPVIVVYAATAIGGTVAGVAGAWLLASGRRLLTALMFAPFAIAALMSMPPVQERVLSNLRETAFHHAGHVVTAGYSYELLNPRYYPNRIQVLHSMPADDAARYAIAAIWSYFVQPVPWAESRAVRAYLPEQIAWYGMVLLLPFGVVFGLRRDRTVVSPIMPNGPLSINGSGKGTPICRAIRFRYEEG